MGVDIDIQIVELVVCFIKDFVKSILEYLSFNKNEIYASNDLFQL